MAKPIAFTESQIEFLEDVKDLIKSHIKENIHNEKRTNAVVYAKFLFVSIVTNRSNSFHKFSEYETAHYLGIDHSTINFYKNRYAPPTTFVKDLSILRKCLKTVLSEKVPKEYIKKLVMSNKIEIEDLIDAIIEVKNFNEYEILKFSDSLKKHCLNRILDKVKN